MKQNNICKELILLYKFAISLLFILLFQVGERVYVIEETGEGFRGVCRNRYKTFPKDTLRIMTTTEVSGLVHTIHPMLTL